MVSDRRELTEYARSLIKLDEALGRNKEDFASVGGVAGTREAIRAELARVLNAAQRILAGPPDQRKTSRWSRRLRWYLLLYWPKSWKAWVSRIFFYFFLFYAVLFTVAFAHSVWTAEPFLEGVPLSTITLETALFIFAAFFFHLVSRKFDVPGGVRDQPSPASRALLWYPPPNLASGFAQFLFYDYLLAMIGNSLMVAAGHPSLVTDLGVPSAVLRRGLLLIAAYLWAKAESRPVVRRLDLSSSFRSVLLLCQPRGPSFWVSSVALFVQVVLFFQALTGLLTGISATSTIYGPIIAVTVTYIWALEERRRPRNEGRTSSERLVPVIKDEADRGHTARGGADPSPGIKFPPIGVGNKEAYASAGKRVSGLKRDVVLVLLGAGIASATSLVVMRTQNRFQQQQFLFARRLDFLQRYLSANEKQAKILAGLGTLEQEIDSYGPRHPSPSEELNIYRQSRELFQEESQLKAYLNAQFTMFNALFHANVPVVNYENDSSSASISSPIDRQLAELHDAIESAQGSVLSNMREIQQTCLKLAAGLGR